MSATFSKYLWYLNLKVSFSVADPPRFPRYLHVALFPKAVNLHCVSLSFYCPPTDNHWTVPNPLPKKYHQPSNIP